MSSESSPNPASEGPSEGRTTQVLRFLLAPLVLLALAALIWAQDSRADDAAEAAAEIGPEFVAAEVEAVAAESGDALDDEFVDTADTSGRTSKARGKKVPRNGPAAQAENQAREQESAEQEEEEEEEEAASGPTTEEYLTDEQIFGTATHSDPDSHKPLDPKAARTAKEWDKLIDKQGGEQVHFGIKLGGGGEASFERNAQEPFVPASLTKLFTTGAALEKLGPDFRFKTRLSWNPTARKGVVTNLTVIGSGDPSWGLRSLKQTLSTPFDRMAKLLVRAGVREIQGEIRFASSGAEWESEALPQGWYPRHLLTCDGALPRAFNLALNCAKLRITEVRGQNGALHARWELPGVPTSVRLAIVAGTVTQLRAERDGRSGYVIEGTWAKGTSPRLVSLPIWDTAEWSRRLLVPALRANGIHVAAQPSSGPVTGASPAAPATAERSVLFVSPPLKDILKPLLKSSKNLIGEALLTAMGGPDATRAYVTDRLPSPIAAEITLHDGSGISRANRATPRALFALLEALRESKTFGAIWRTLPVAGVDGTLRKRMRKTAAEGVLRAKTGTLNGAYNLAGYVPRFNAVGAPVDFVPFVIFARAPGELRYTALAAHNRVGARLSKLVNH
jgi:D-alanyl-D-alanine carboxypeptidase/D-alanyl-D-alanine-endopeptidase (penicillin-binding protein 4)